MKVVVSAAVEPSPRGGAVPQRPAEDVLRHRAGPGHRRYETTNKNQRGTVKNQLEGAQREAKEAEHRLTANKEHCVVSY